MSKRDIHASTNYIDMQEDELKAFLLNRYEYLKTLEEKQKSDEHLKNLVEGLKEYKDTTYTQEKKMTKAELKAARAVAKARGIEFKLPGEH